MAKKVPSRARRGQGASRTSAAARTSASRGTSRTTAGRSTRSMPGVPPAVTSPISPAHDPIYRTNGDPEFLNSYLLVPKDLFAGNDEANVTWSPAAVIRAQQGASLELRTPTARPETILQKIGLQDYEKVRVSGTPQEKPVERGRIRGIFAKLLSLGMAAAFFRDQTEVDNARTDLANDFEFVPNFPLTIPLRRPLNGVADTRSHRPMEFSQWPEECGVRDAHRRGIRGAGVLLGVVDTGIDADHQEFTHQLVPFRYVPLFPNDVPPRDIRGFDTDGHGSHVAGIAAGREIGVAPETNLFSASVIESETTRSSLIRLLSGLEWMLGQFRRPENERRPAVLNLSLGFPRTAPTDIDAVSYDGRIKTMQALIRTMVKNNVLPVVAIGNEGRDNSRYPGAFPEVVGVGAVDFDKNIAEFSGSTPLDDPIRKPDIFGYGVGIHSSVERDYSGRSIYQNFNGTSMATPYVAGIAALYRCRRPAAPVDEIIKELKDNALPVKGARAGLAAFR